MSTSRSKLHISKLEEFAAFCEKHGWFRVELKSPFEVLRMRNFEMRDPLIVYKKLAATEHLTTHGEAMLMTKLYIKARKAGFV